MLKDGNHSQRTFQQTASSNGIQHEQTSLQLGLLIAVDDPDRDADGTYSLLMLAADTDGPNDKVGINDANTIKVRT